MDLSGVIEELVEERGLDRERVTQIVCDGIRAAYEKKFPGLVFHVVVNKRTSALEVESDRRVVSAIADPDHEILLRRARVIKPKAEIGETLSVPFEQAVGRVEVLVARQIIAQGIRQLEQEAIHNEFKSREGTLINGTIHKKERAGFAVNLGEVVAFLPNSCVIPGENLRVGFPIRVLLKEVLPSTHGGYQLILDRASPDFVKKLLEAEIPEVFEGTVEVKKIVRAAGYKTKIALVSHSKEIDPVGTCVGVGGSRIKPILKELGQEKVDLIAWQESLEALVRGSLKPAEIESVKIAEDGSAHVWLAEDQRSFAIGKLGQNINLASELAGVPIHLQESTAPRGERLFAGESATESAKTDDVKEAGDK